MNQAGWTGPGEASPAWRCPRCGGPVSAGARFCGTCGLAFAPAAPAPLPVPSGARGARFPGAGLAALVLLLVVAVGAFAILQGAGRSEPGASPGSADTAGSAGMTSDGAFDPGARPERIPDGPDVGAFEAAFPVEDAFIESPWGMIPGDTWWVMLEPGRDQKDAEALLAMLGDGEGTAIVGRIEAINAWQIRIPSALPPDEFLLATDFLGQQEGVRAVTPEVPYELKGCADDLHDADYTAEAGAEGAYNLIDADGAWAAWYASRLPKHIVHAAVVDTAISAAPSGRPFEFDEATFDGSPVADPAVGEYDGFTHADGVMGILAGDRGDGGIAGIASPLGGSLVISHFDWTRNNSYKTTVTGDGRSTRSGGVPTFGTAMVDTLAAVKAGATVINLSVGPTTPGAHNAAQSAMWRELVGSMAANHPDVLFVVAAGNEAGTLDGRNYGMAGIRADNVITVGNVTTANRKVTGKSGSNFLDPNAVAGDAEVTIAAPGDQSIWGKGQSGALMRTNNGTSSATPMVAATATLIRSLAPGLTAKEIKDVIAKSGQAGPNDLGGRTLSAGRAVRDAIDLVRAKAGRPALTDAEIAAVEDLCRIGVTGTPSGEVEGKPGYLTWAVGASLDAVPEPTSLTLTIRGGLRPTDWKKAVRSPSDVALWQLTVPRGGLAVIVARTDIGFAVTRTLAGGEVPSPEPSAEPEPTPQITAAPPELPTAQPATPAPPGPTPASGFDCSKPPPGSPKAIANIPWYLACGGSISP